MAGRQTKGPRPKHIPQRTCIACRRSDAKRTLIRLVRTPEGRVEVDPTGKRAGRGAYLCTSRSCWELALKRQGMLGRALRTELLPDDRVALEQYARQLPDQNNVIATTGESTAP